ncbi:acidic amino acid decarboxylase GADL1 isoform X4 [Oryzias melastigma]|uniref:acidic amino acid decarboxylase GADL1 isoform X4 n=1 Tax=Oryzias melastigma TaxID=30732 RepID=UPI000CF83BA8|nr:acidic amino acid decarboxylase GADL1 isoform X4 [Oryzias melastigma]
MSMEQHMNGQSPETDLRNLSKFCQAVTDGLPLEESAERFIHEAMEVIIDEAVKKATDVKEKVCEWQSPEQLKELLDLELKDGGESDSKILQRCKNAIRYSVKTSHPRFFNQLFAGMEPYSMVASFIIEAVKTSLYTYEVAPVFTLMEDAVLKKMMELIGWDEGGDGIFNPGGSMSNMYAVNLARYRLCPNIKEVGLYDAPRLVMFTSQEGHYSISKAAGLLGFGTKNVYVVPCDNRGKMIPLALEEKIQLARSEGAVPLLVNATAGTTVFGAFDPVDKIADICELHSLWLHVDACWGGAALLSSAHKHLLKGIHRYLAQEVKKREGFRLLMEPEYANVCFWYVPPALRDIPDGPELWRKLHTHYRHQACFSASCSGLLQVAPVVKERMMKTGSMMIGYQTHGDKPNFFRMVVINPQVSKEDLDFVLNEIHNLGKDLR